MTLDEFVRTKVLPKYRDIGAMLRKLMHELAPDATETIRYGIPPNKGKHMLAVISPTKKDTTFAFPVVLNLKIGMDYCRALEKSQSI